MSVPLRVVSYGGGVQSTALLVLAAQRRIPHRTFLFANVGEDSEHPDSLRYVREIAAPYAEAHDIELVELHKVRKGETDTLRQAISRGRRVIPFRRYKDGPPMSRACTSEWKVGVVAKELKRRGATKASPALVALGISVDEIQRAQDGVDPRNPTQRREYPLLGLGMHRRDCAAAISDAGLPVPPKSSCFFCPFHDAEAWRTLKRNRPDLFAQSCEVEAELSASSKDGRVVFLTRSGLPLADAVDDQAQLPGMGDDCDSGYCFT